MKPLSITLVLFGLLALMQPAYQLDLPGALLGIVVLLCAVTTFRSTEISSFLRIFVGHIKHLPDFLLNIPRFRESSVRKTNDNSVTSP